MGPKIYRIEFQKKQELLNDLLSKKNLPQIKDKIKRLEGELDRMRQVIEQTEKLSVKPINLNSRGIRI